MTEEVSSRTEQASEKDVVSSDKSSGTATTSPSSGDVTPLQMLFNLSSSMLSEDPHSTSEKAGETVLSEKDTAKTESLDDLQIEPTKSTGSDEASSKSHGHSHYSGRHGNWTPEEDALLLKLVAKYDTARTKQWTYIAKMMGTGRIGKQCRDRYLNHTGPNVVKAPWTPEEDRIIILSQKLYGNSWTRIAGILGNGRPANGIKNRWNSCLRHRYIEIDGESLDEALAKGHLNSNGVITVQKARKRASEPTGSLDGSKLTRPHKQRKTLVRHPAPETGVMDMASIAQTTSVPESPKMATSPLQASPLTTPPLQTSSLQASPLQTPPVVGSVSPGQPVMPSAVLPQVQLPQIPCSFYPGLNVPANSLLWQAVYAPPVPMGSFGAVQPNFISIRPETMLMNSPFITPTGAFLPVFFQQQQQQPIPTIPIPKVSDLQEQPPHEEEEKEKEEEKLKEGEEELKEEEAKQPAIPPVQSTETPESQ